MKRLFLASEAKHPESMKKLEEFVGGLKGKSIAYIPTAANGEEPYGIWEKESATWLLVNNTGTNVEAVVLEEKDNDEICKKLKGKDIIWFAGGMCGYLMYWVRRRQVDRYLSELLEKGSVYVGSSAGSMVCAKTLQTAEVYLDENETGASAIPGLGLIDFDFYPHYEDEMLPQLKKVWKGGDLYLVKNGEAITVEANKITVLGDKRILRESKLYR